MKRIFLFLICLAYGQAWTIYAQTSGIIQGVVTDVLTGEPIELATVKLLQGNAEKLTNYALTDAKGYFNINPGKQTDSLLIAVSLLGYKEMKKPGKPGETVHFQLEQEVFSIREVEIRPGRVWGRQDTINYDVAQFLSPRDESIKDVIKKLPGVDVDELGRISYNGKNISNFYVEGMDLTDGRYSQITNNLDAKAVETVQVLENHQPIRLLQDKVKVEDIAINLKLNENYRDKWIVGLRGGAGLDLSDSDISGKDILWEGALDALQLSRHSQSTYIYKGNNTGVDVVDEFMSLAALSSGRLRETNVPSFLNQPSLTAPLKKNRWLFNDVHSLSGNRMYKLNETTQLRFNAGYTHDIRQQERGSETTYYQAEDTLHISEQSRNRIRSEQANLGLFIENNDSDHFLTNRFNASGTWTNSRMNFMGNRDFSQKIGTTDMGIKNDFRNMWNTGDNTWEIRSLLRYNYLPADLTIDESKEKLNLNQFYTDNSFAFLHKRGNLTQRYTAGMTGQVSNIQNGMSAYMTPNWQISDRKWQGSLTTPLVWTSFPGTDFSRLALNPSFWVQYKYNYAWRFSLNASYREQYGDITDFYTSPYRTDYRNTVATGGFLSMSRNQNYSIYAEYKNTIREFFATLSLNHNRTWSNRTFEQSFENEQMILTSREMSTDANGWQLRGTFSKSYYDWNMKTSLDYQFSTQKAERLSEGQRLPFRANYMQYEPKISWTPNRRMETNYQATFRYGGSKIGNSRLTPLWNIVQQFQYTYILFPIEITVSADHYYNDVNNDKSVNAFLVNASLRWKQGSWQFDFLANNLINKTQYSYTQYSSLESYTSWINIRGREFLFSAKYRF